MPFDILLMELNVNSYFYRILRFLRLLKIPRVIEFWSSSKDEKMNQSIYSKLIILALFYLIFNHLAACFLYFAANQHRNSSDPDTMGNIMDNFIIPS
jgi:hypothetical protein